MALPDAALALIDAALAEDVGPGDFTSLWTVPAGRRAEACIVTKAPGVVAGTGVAAEVFRRVDPSLDRRGPHARRDGGGAGRAGDVRRRLRSLAPHRRAHRPQLPPAPLRGGHGHAALRRAVEGTGARVIDTRKTTPGMRRLEKAAVVAGGGANHRVGLHDMVMIKDNHVAAAGGISAAVEAVRRAQRPRAARGGGDHHAGGGARGAGGRGGPHHVRQHDGGDDARGRGAGPRPPVPGGPRRRPPAGSRWRPSAPTRRRGWTSSPWAR
jgi:hypothetical protein